ncbi:thiamine pyrophosphate-binding protein [Nonomuraea sp. NPDC050478]|uniref:thiamine pyrophosphate-binding protein n=1 Tax=Nonomuraea sp. NPDC050478 TaxID=3364365 RepID=UPI0037A33335
MLLYDYLASAFEAEGVDTLFGLMGDGNMFWMTAMAERPGVTVIHARHENAAVAMADGYARATGRVGVATVTCGPGLTQVLTSLTASVRHRTPMVILTGQTPVEAAFHLQELEQEPLVRAAGAEFIRVSTVNQALDAVARAFFTARMHRAPVVLSVPYDLQETDQPWTEVITTSAALVPEQAPLRPSPESAAEIAHLLGAATSPVIVAGAGAVRAGCRADILELAERAGARVATTLPAKDWFEGEPRDVGLAGAFASEAAREIFAGADLVLGVGARMGYYTTEGGYLFPAARVVQIDTDPAGYLDGQRVADSYTRADAAEAVAEILKLMPPRGAARDAPSGRPRPDRADDQPDGPAPGTHRPEAAVATIDRALPKDASITVGVGHFWNYVVPGMTGRGPASYHFTYDFGAIGQAVPTAIGVAVARRSAGIDTPCAVIEGDGSLLMNVQELETIARHDIPLLVIVMNDGAYGAEYHKLAARGISGEQAVSGRTDLARTARSFGLRAERCDSDEELRAAVAAFVAEPAPTLVDVPIDHRAVSVQYRRLHYGTGTVSFGGDE